MPRCAGTPLLPRRASASAVGCPRRGKAANRFLPWRPHPHPREGQAGGSVLEQGSSRARRDAGPGQTAGPALRAGRSGFASVLALGPRSLAWDRQDPETVSES